jgi:hypothetical protein
MLSRTIGIIVFLTFLIISPAQAQVSFHTGFYLDWWTSDSGDYGRQARIPLVLEGEFEAFSFSLTTARVYNRFEPDSQWVDVSTINGQTDTKVNLGYEIMDRWPVDLLVALDVNLPSGKTGLSNADVINISQPDLFTITRMGQGLNINPSVSLLKQWDRLLASVGVGYIWRGSYDASETLENYDPGNALSLTAETAYYFNPQWTAKLFGGWTSYTADRREGESNDYYKPGDVWSFGAVVGYTRAQWHINGSLTRVLREKDTTWRYINPVGIDFAVEDHNRHGDEWIAQISGGYSLTDRTDLKVDIQYLTVDANEYDPSEWEYYESKRTKTAIGCEVIHRWSAVFESGLRLSTFTLAVDDNPDDWDEEDDFSGGSAALWGTFRF